ncbi:zf-HC2 domain-containing protein [Desulfococcaceae bacterium HSG8]|nr:zf-HC2 domain-containing protein [Desulfococcaceae bacterium HSG8]
MKKLMEMIKLLATKENKIGLDKALENDGDFLAFLGQEARSEEYGKLKEHAGKSKAHPTGEMLYDYALGCTDEKDTMRIRNHISFCDACSDEVLEIMGIEGDLEGEALKWAGPPIIWISEPWEPRWAGELVTAADIAEQENAFELDSGQIMLTCHWKSAYRDTPAYICISWKADITKYAELWIRFSDTETREIRSEFCLGTNLVGETFFESDEIGFDPSTQRWAVSLVLCQPES